MPEWWVLGCKLQAASCKLQAASCKLQAASCKLQAASCKLQAASCKLQAASKKNLRGLMAGVKSFLLYLLEACSSKLVAFLNNYQFRF
ncbi:hypothetical protein KO489_03660 [Reinekea forsetii]|nr:hypothetical protein [Reinekea forsetii]